MCDSSDCVWAGLGQNDCVFGQGFLAQGLQFCASLGVSKQDLPMKLRSALDEWMSEPSESVAESKKKRCAKDDTKHPKEPKKARKENGRKRKSG